MFEQLKNMWRRKFSASRYAAEDRLPPVVPKRRRSDPAKSNLNKTSTHVRSGSNLRPTQRAETPNEFDSDTETRIESRGPGKNVLVRSKYVREDTDIQETLQIVDDDSSDGANGSGIDPYNTGGFDRSKNWDNRFRK